MLQILDNGRLTDAKGRHVNFKNAILIMTSNVGSEYIRQLEKIGFAVSASDETRQKETGEEMKDKIKTALENRFRSEFLNRLDEIIIFNPLSPEEIKNIVKIQVELTVKRLVGKGINLKITEQALSFLAKKAIIPTMAPDRSSASSKARFLTRWRNLLSARKRRREALLWLMSLTTS